MLTCHKAKYGIVVFLVSVMFWGITGAVIAQDASDLMEMELDDLMNMEVTTASKQAESLNDAPGVITTITAKEIEQFGATSLLGVLERATTIYAIGTSGFPQGMISIRGDAATTINNHVLVLLDGRPMRESLHGGLNTPIYTAFPLESIDRIEIVRGPGSVLYGSNAYAGVINIITKQPEMGTTFSAKTGVGSFDQKRLVAHGGYKSGELSISGGLRIHREQGQGESITYVPGEDPNDFSTYIPVVQNEGETFNLGEDVIGATVSAHYKGFSFQSFAGVNEQGYYPSGFSTEPAEFRHITTDLGYEHSILRTWDASVNLTFNYDRQLHNGADESNRDFILEATNYIRPYDNTNLIVGGLLYSLQGQSEMEMADMMDPTAPPAHIQSVDPYTALWWSAYTQLDFRPVEKLKLIAGGQVNKVEGLDLDFVPRLGAVFNATDRIGTKLLYGQAFRSPYAVERSIDIPGILQGNPDLNPEKVTSLDAQIFYNAPQMQLAATYFNASQKDLIVKTSYWPEGAVWPLSTYENQGELTTQGIELEAKGSPVDHLFLTGSFVYQRSEDGQGEWGTTLVPEMIGKLGASYAMPMGVTIGLFDSYFSAPRPLSDISADMTATEYAPDPETYHYATAKVGFDVTTMMGLSDWPKIGVDFYMTNLLGEELYVTDIDLTNNSVPRQHGRAFYGTLSVGL